MVFEDGDEGAIQKTMAKALDDNLRLDDLGALGGRSVQRLFIISSGGSDLHAVYMMPMVMPYVISLKSPVPG